MPETRHTVIVESAEALAAALPIEDARVRAHKLAESPGATVVAMAFDAGTVLSSHIAPGPILIQTISGEVIVEVEDEKVRLPLGGIVHIDTRVPHEVRAVTKARITVTILQGVAAEQPAVPGIIRKTMLPVADVSGRDASGRDVSGRDASSADASSRSGATADSNVRAVGGAASAAGDPAHDHDCTCGEADEPLPELDVRTIPHAIRHATVFGALDGMQPEKSLVLVAHHDPLPLLAQIEHRYDGAIGVAYGQRGPEVWKLQLTRTR